MSSICLTWDSILYFWFILWYFSLLSTSSRNLSFKWRLALAVYGYDEILASRLILIMSFMLWNDMSNGFRETSGDIWLSEDKLDVMIERPCSYECFFLSLDGFFTCVAGRGAVFLSSNIYLSPLFLLRCGRSNLLFILFNVAWVSSVVERLMFQQQLLIIYVVGVVLLSLTSCCLLYWS